MKYYLERVIPVVDGLLKEDWNVLMGQIKSFIKELSPQEETLSGTLILTDSQEGVSLAREAGLPCLGMELTAKDMGKAEIVGKESVGKEILACPYVVTDISAVTPICLEQVYRRFYDIPWEILESERCVVREGTEADAAQILEIYGDVEEFSLTKPFATIEEGHQYMQDYREMVYRLYEYGLWVVEEKESGELIGVAGLENQIFKEQEYLALGYVIGEKWRRQGYAKEVCQAILTYGREELGLETLHCFVEPENGVSLHLVEKLGFCREGEVIQQKEENRGEEKQLYHYIWKNR